jgi:hypothetical protein
MNVDEEQAFQCINIIETGEQPHLSLIKINSESDADFYVTSERLYIIHLKETNRYVFVKCGFKAILAADMQILFEIKDKKRDTEFSDYIISYKYKNYNKLAYDSFNHLESCDVYYIENLQDK